LGTATLALEFSAADAVSASLDELERASLARPRDEADVPGERDAAGAESQRREVTVPG